MREIKALVFDMDGLIFDSERIVQRSWTITSKELGLPDVGEHIYHTIGFNVKRREEYFCSVFGKDFPTEEFNQHSRKNFHQIAETEGVPLKPGVEELLKEAKQQRLKLAVATSSREVHALDMLRKAGLYQYFDGAMYGDKVKNAKPDPEIYLKACELIAVKPSESIALEDSPAGIEAAYRAGMKPVMIPDLVEPNQETLAMCYKKYETLLDAMELIR